VGNKELEYYNLFVEQNTLMGKNVIAGIATY
jgi:cell division protein FtsL